MVKWKPLPDNRARLKVWRVTKLIRNPPPPCAVKCIVSHEACLLNFLTFFITRGTFDFEIRQNCAKTDSSNTHWLLRPFMAISNKKFNYTCLPFGCLKMSSVLCEESLHAFLFWFWSGLAIEFTYPSFPLIQASDDSSDSPEPGPITCMEPFLVRRLSCRTVQLPPLAFRQAEQYYCDRKPESDTVTVPPRPTTLPLRTPPLIAITSADTSR